MYDNKTVSIDAIDLYNRKTVSVNAIDLCTAVNMAIRIYKMLINSMPRALHKPYYIIGTANHQQILCDS